MFRWLAGSRTRVPQLATWLSSLTGSGSSRGVKTANPANAAFNNQEFTPHGRQLIATLRAHDIGLYGEMENVSKLQWRGTAIKMASRHVVNAFSMRYFTDVVQAYAETAVRRMIEDHEKPLWLFTNMKGDFRPIVRGKAKYRLNVAIRQALRNSGYDKYGRRLSEDELREHSKVIGREIQLTASTKNIAQLFATVEIIARDPAHVVNCQFADLLNFFTGMVRHLEARHARTWDHSKAKSFIQGTGRPQLQPQEGRRQIQSQQIRPQYQSQQKKPQYQLQPNRLQYQSQPNRPLGGGQKGHFKRLGLGGQTGQRKQE